MTLNNTKVQDAERVAQIEEEQAQEARDNVPKIEEANRLEQEKNEAINRLNLTAQKAFIDSLPIRDDTEVAKLISIEYKTNLTDAKKAINTYPNKYEIQGHDVPSMIKQMRQYRRKLKGEDRETMTKSIENVIYAYTDYLDKCIDNIYWIRKYKVPLKKIGYDETSLRKLNSITDEDTRRDLIDKLCKIWEFDLNSKKKAHSKERVVLTKNITKIKKEFNSIVKKRNKPYSTKEDLKKQILKIVCDTPGISSRQIHETLPYNLHKKSTPHIIAKMAKDQDIINIDGSHYKINDDIKKNIWAYTAAFIDSDGYITMDKNNNPRVGLVATGTRGKAFMIGMQKSLGCGRLHLDQKSPQDTRPVNRLNFYSQEDISKLLTKCRPHFKLKGNNADVLLELIRMKKSHKKQDWYKGRCDELFKLMKYYNHSDNTRFDWSKYDIDIENISKLENNSKTSIMDDLDGLAKA
jgi:hypothetical protein